jgi:hypothetical protein
VTENPRVGGSIPPPGTSLLATSSGCLFNFCETPLGEWRKFFGEISGAAITLSYNQLTNELARDKGLSAKVNKIKGKIINI